MMETPKRAIPEQKIEEAAVQQVSSSSGRAFVGFAPPTSNTTYTPNQFFDVCLPHSSRGCVRLVSYMLRRTLGWCDADGNPQEDQLVISYNDLENYAGISRGAISDAIEEAIDSNFVRCIRKGRPKATGQPAVTALYELAWDSSAEYIKDPRRFSGFYEAEGNRTDIPNEFFDVVVRSEPLAVIKVVGAIIRFSIGFQARRGARRQQVQLSFSDIQRYAKISVRRHLSSAIQHAVKQNYIVRVQEGLFTPDREQQVSTTYAVKWLDHGPYSYIGSKKTPEATALIGSKKTPEDRFKKDTRDGSKKTPEDRFKKDTTIETKTTNETYNKQQQAPAAAETFSLAYQLLKQQGFSERDAEALAKSYPEDTITKQIAWLPERNPSRNRLGMLRRAIEEGWPAPDQCQSSDLAHGKNFAAHFYAGYAGNNDEPATSPTLGDAQDAQAFVIKLLAIWPDEDRIPAWGRSVGKLYAQRATKGAFHSCRLALRVCGDEFYARIRAERETLRKEELQRVRNEHRRRYAMAYREFVISEELRIRKSDPEAYQAFEESRNNEREQIVTAPFCFSEEFRTEQLRRFDDPNQRLRDFAKHFSVYSFWQWDRELNSQRFDERSHVLCG